MFGLQILPNIEVGNQETHSKIEYVYATDDKNLLFWLRLASYFLSDFSINAYIHILISRKGAKRQFLKIKCLLVFCKGVKKTSVLLPACI